MIETIAANHIGNFKLPVSTKSLRKRFCQRDQEPLNITYRRPKGDLYENGNSFSAYANFNKIKNVVLPDTSEASLKANSDLMYSERINSEQEVRLSQKYFLMTYSITDSMPIIIQYNHCVVSAIRKII